MAAKTTASKPATKTTTRKPAAKKPQDHQPKKPTVKEVDGGKQVTVEGVTATILTVAMQDWTTGQKLARLRKGGLKFEDSVILAGELFDRIFGDEQSERIIAELADENGYTEMPKVMQFFNAAIGAAFPNS